MPVSSQQAQTGSLPLRGSTPPPARLDAPEGLSEAAGPYSIGSDHWPGLSKVVEEMGELGQVLGKLIALNGATEHWDGTDLRERLHEEIADLSAALAFFEQHNSLNSEVISERTVRKNALFQAWHAEQSRTMAALRSLVQETDTTTGTDANRVVLPSEEGYEDAFDVCPEPTCPLYQRAVMADHRHLPGRSVDASRQVPPS